MKIRIITIFGCIFLCVASFSQETYTLEQCKELALKNNAKAQNSQLAIEMAEQTKKEAFTNYFPSVSAIGAGFKSSDPMMSMNMGGGTLEMLNDGMIGAVSASQPVFTGGQIVNGNKLAKEGLKVSKLQKIISDNEILQTTEQYYWQFISMTEKIKTIEDAGKMLEQLYSDVNISVQAGLTTKNDLLKVELEQNRLKANKLKLANGLNLVRMAMAQHVGIVLSDSFIIALPTDQNVPTPLEFQTGHKDAVLQRAEYLLLTENVDITKLQLKMKLGEYMPTVAVGIGYNYMLFDNGSASESKNDFGMGFATVSVPISGWWGGSYAIHKKRMEAQVAENTREQASQMLLLQMQQLWNELGENYQQIQLAKQSITLAEENVNLNNNYYKAGTAILSDLLDAQYRLQQNLDQYSEAVINYRMILSNYLRATKNNK